MKFFYKFLLLTIVTMASCSKDDSVSPEPNPENPKTGEEAKNDSITYFTLNVNEFYLNDNYKSGYIIINDNEGKLIDYKKIKNSEQYVFKAKKSEVLNTFSVTRFLELEGYNATDTYFNIEEGAVWNFQRSVPIQTPAASSNRVSFNLSVENVSGWSNYRISGVGGYGSSSSTIGGSTIDYSNITAFENSKYMLTVNFNSRLSKYIILDAARDGETVTINGDELLEFDSYIDVNVPNDTKEYTKTLHAEYDKKFRFSTNISTKMTSSVPSKFGLLDAFSNYVIRINTSDTQKNFYYSYNYDTLLPKDINISPFNTDFSLINSNLESFEFTTNINYEVKSSLWRKAVSSVEEVVNLWELRSNDMDYNKLPTLPEELMNEYPSFEVETLEYQRTYLIKQGTPYSNFFQNSENNNQDMIRETLRFDNPAINNKTKKIDDKFIGYDYQHRDF